MFDWTELGGAPSDVLVKVFAVSFFSFFFFSNFGNPAQERYRRYPESAISVNTLIAGFTVFFRLIVCFF